MTREIKNRVAQQTVAKPTTSKQPGGAAPQKQTVQLGKGGAVPKKEKGCC